MCQDVCDNERFNQYSLTSKTESYGRTFWQKHEHRHKACSVSYKRPLYIHMYHAMLDILLPLQEFLFFLKEQLAININIIATGN